MVNRRRVLAGLLGAIVSLGITPRAVDGHPLHTTITELTEDRARGTVRAMIRVFADDFGTAVSKSARGKIAPNSGAAWDAAVLAYATSAFGLQDAQGRTIPMRSCGVKRTSELVWLCLEAVTTQPLGSLRVRNAVLCDLFDDQVNVVQGTVNGKRRSLLFMRGDRYKPIQ